MPKQALGIIGGAVIVIALGGVLFFAQPKTVENHDNMNQTPNPQALKINFEPLSFDFGTISMKDGKVTKSFKVNNSSGNDIDLSTVYTSCMCTSAKLILDGAEYGPFGMQGHGAMKMLNRIFATGAEGELLVTFDPNAHGPAGVGLIERTVSLQSNKGDIASVNIKANVVP